MSTYDLTTSVGKVRLIIGDTAAPFVFTNAEITYFLTVNSNNINLAAADALEAWVAKYTTAPDSEKIGDYSYSQKIVDHLNKLAKELRTKADGVPYLTWAEMDLSGVEDTTVSEDIE
ncbi:hypothetical protein ES703_47790 [subsurface metagenome]